MRETTYTTPRRNQYGYGFAQFEIVDTRDGCITVTDTDTNVSARYGTMDEALSAVGAKRHELKVL